MSLYVLTPAAEDDIRAILAYIEQDNPSIADRVRDGLRDAMRVEVPHHLPTGLETAGDVRVLRGKRDVRQILDV
jgi:hypothetical protein